MSGAKTAVIEDILGTREWDGPNGKVFYFDVLMDNEDRGSIGKKSNTALKVGDSLTYTLEVGERGNKIKEFKEGGFNGGYNGNGGKPQSRGGNESFSLSYAKDVVCSMLANGYVAKDKNSSQITEVTLAIADKFNNWLNENKS